MEFCIFEHKESIAIAIKADMLIVLEYLIDQTDNNFKQKYKNEIDKIENFTENELNNRNFGNIITKLFNTN